MVRQKVKINLGYVLNRLFFVVQNIIVIKRDQSALRDKDGMLHPFTKPGLGFKIRKEWLRKYLNFSDIRFSKIITNSI